MKLIILFLVFLNTFVFAYSSNRLLDIKDNDSSSKKIVDIGINSNITRQNYRYEKILQDVSSNNVVLSHEIILKKRNVTEKACVFDQYNHKSCPEEKTSCDRIDNFIAGNVIKHDGTVTVPYIVTVSPPIYTVSTLIPNTTIPYIFFDDTFRNIFIQDVTGTKTISLAPGMTVYVRSVSPAACDDDLQTVDISVTGSNITSVQKRFDCPSVRDLDYVELYKNTTESAVTVTVSETAQHYGVGGDDVTAYLKVGHPGQNIYSCPDGYYDDGSQCRKDYIYYTYTCPTELNQWEESWVGPMVSTGGDCHGNGVAEAKNGVCPNAGPTPPAENCRRFSFKCPVGDGDTECVLDNENATENQTNVFDGYQYAIADSTKFTKTFMTEPTCPKTNNELKGCDIGWELFEADKCYKKAINSSEANCVNFNGTCYEDLGLPIQNINGVPSYVKDAILGYDNNIGGCISNYEKKCTSPGYEYSETLDQCIKSPECDYKDDQGNCYSLPEKRCKDGFIFIDGSCKAEPYCSSGDLKITVSDTGVVDKICENDNSNCPSANFILDRDVVGKCSKDLETTDAICATTGLTPENGSNICFETVEYSRWTTNSIMSTYNLAQAWSEINEAGSPVMYQANNTYGVYLYPRDLSSFILTGKVRVGTGCGGGDNDTIGFTFGYKDKENFWALGWVRGDNDDDSKGALTGWSGNSNLGLQLVKVVNGTAYALASLNNDYGWRCTTTYTEFKIINDDNGIKIYQNGNLVINYTQGSAPKGKAGYLMYSQGEGYYKDFTLHELPICPEGYLFDAGSSKCYKDYGSDKQYDFARQLVFEDPTCSDGYIDSNTGQCITESKCSDGATKTYGSSSGPICELSQTEECNDNATYSNLHLFDNFNGSCKINELCQSGSIAIQNTNGEYTCASTSFSDVCPNGYTSVDNFGEVKCIAFKECPDGYIEYNGMCKLSYNWYEYTCPAGYSKSNEIFDNDIYTAGGDCNASCGTNDCNCNSPIAPANSCRKPVSSTSSDKTTIMKKDLQIHRIIGDTLLPEYMNIEKNTECSNTVYSCNEAVNKIEGNGNKLCFYEKNGQKSCFSVEGCSFIGSVTADNYFTSIYLSDPYTLIPREYQPLEAPVDYSVMIIESDPHKGIDYCNDGSGIDKDFVNFNGCPREGITPDILSLKLSDGNWYAKSTGVLRCGGGNFKALNTMEVLTPSSYDGSALKLRIRLPEGLKIEAISDYESVSQQTFGVAACNSDNAYDESYKVYPEGHPELAVKTTRRGFGVAGSTEINLSEGSFEPFIPDNNKTIQSTCKMNGFVGWSDRIGPITSVGNNAEDYTVTMFDVNGTATEKDGTEWTGFNAATMAVQFNNSDWYVMGNVLSNDGSSINVEKPSFVKTLPSSYYSISASENTVCKYKGKNIFGSVCGNRVIVRGINLKDKVTKIAPVKTLFSLFDSASPFDTSSDNYDLHVYALGQFQGTITNNNSSIQIPELATYVNKDKSLELDYNNRLRFWDPFKDYNIGFIEFVPEVYPSDRLEGYVPDLLLYDEMLAEGFTSIKLPAYDDKYLSDNSKLGIGITYFVKPTRTENENCNEYAIRFSLTRVDPTTFNVVDQEKLYKVLGFRENSACILAKQGVEIPSAAKYAILKKTWTGPKEFFCSPYTCVGTTCKIETCQDNTNGQLLTSEYDNSTACKEQKCDGNKDYVPFCGITGPCPNGSKEDSSGNCIQNSCPDGSEYHDGKCQILRCPDGTTEHDDGGCYKN